MRSTIKKWIKTGCKNPSNLKTRLQTDLAALMETKEVTHTLLIQEKELNLKILNAAKEEEELRVKSRQLWLKGGDSNTEYFHKKPRLARATIS